MAKKMQARAQACPSGIVIGGIRGKVLPNSLSFLGIMNAPAFLP
jgi:hypothetical protein